jgi:hypothetical protein
MHLQTLTNRKQTAFRLNEDLLNRLKIAAQKENRSLNNYVESVLTGIVSLKPNKETLEAMKEAGEIDNLATLDLDNFENFVASL